MADQLLYEMSNDTVQESEPFVQKQMVYIIDQNNSSYSSNQILVDTSSLSNSGKYASYSEAFLTVPLVIALDGVSDATGFNTQLGNFAAGIKNGYYQFIHSMSVEYNNTNVIQLTPYTNFYVNYKLMTSMSQDDLNKIGPTIGFYPDTADSFTYHTAVNANGLGVCNNRNFGIEMLYPQGEAVFNIVAAATAEANAVGTASSKYALFTPDTNFPNGLIQSTANYGFFRRQKMIAHNISLTTYTNLLSEANTRVLLKNFYQTSNTNAVGTAYHAWNVLAHIRLKDMADFFDKMPLVKGAYLRFIINVNTSVSTLQFTTQPAAANLPAYSTMTLTGQTLSNGTCPLMIASHEPNQGGYPVGATTNGTVRLHCGIASLGLTTANTKYTHPQTSCRLYVPLYTMNPVAEDQYLSLNRTKKIVYRDIYQYTIPNQASNGTINQLITNGISNPKTIIIIPIFNSAGNGAVAGVSAGLGYSPYQSPFTSEPATTSPLAAIGDFNIQLAGVNIFQQNIQYDWELFNQELKSVNALNGGLVNGLTSGLITEYDFSMMYRYYVVDVSRRLPAEDLVPKSIQILGKNLSAIAMDYYIFVEVEKSITIDLATGQKLT